MNEIRFTEAHQWIRREQPDVFVVGMTDYAVDQLERQIIAVDLPKAGESCVPNTPYGMVEGARATLDLVSPVSGTILEINNEVLRSPDLVSRDPYGGGWLIHLSPANPAEFEMLLSAEEYDRQRLL